MRKSSRSKGSGIIGKGKVTPTQVAYIVDRYLYDNRFSETRAHFRTEASSLISKSPVRDALKSLLTLDDMLNDYVHLKEQRMAVEQERLRLDQEKIRVQNLLQGMQNVMNTYNASLNFPPPMPAAPIPQQRNYSVPSGCTQYNTPNVMSMSLLGNKRVEFGNFSTPLTSQSITGKRKGPEGSVGAPPVSRKTRTTKAQEKPKANETNKIAQANKPANKFSSQPPSETPTLAINSASNESMTGQGSSVVKCLFNKADSLIPSNSTSPRTPQKRVSPGSQKSTTPQKAVATPTNCTIVTKERFVISPLKKITSYTMERSRVISSSSSPVKSSVKISNKREHVKGRLNFDDNTDAGISSEATTATGDLVSASPSSSEAEADPYDIDFSKLDFLGSFSELLVDFDLVCANTNAQHIETASGSSPESGNDNLDSDQGYPEYAPTVTETIQEKEMSTQEPRVAAKSDVIDLLED